MNAINNIKDKVSEAYVIVIISLMGIAAFISAILIAWPALAYIAAKLFN